MTETKASPASGLYAALAAFQAELPRISKGQTGKVEGEKDGRRYSYEYKYSDLADITAQASPLLGKHGLAFTARPTLNTSGQFVLAYKLTHVSGEDETGEYPLPSPDRVKPQQIGSAITYAKRYSFCAVTGIVPAGEDDDGHAAQQASADAWENATPARQYREQQAPAGNEWEAGTDRPAGNGHAPGASAVSPDAEPDEEAQAIADEAHLARTVRGVSDLHKKAHDAGKLNAVIVGPEKGGKGQLDAYLKWRRQQVQAEHAALTELQAAAEAAGVALVNLDARVKELTGVSIEAATRAQLEEATAKLAAKTEAPA